MDGTACTSGGNGGCAVSTNTYAPLGAVSCISCLPGRFGSDNDCPVLSAGLYRGLGDSTPVYAPNGKYMIGTGHRTTASQATQCPPGHISNAANSGREPVTCYTCADDYQANGDQSACELACTTGEYITGGMPSCAKCPEGRWSASAFDPAFGGATCSSTCNDFGGNLASTTHYIAAAHTGQLDAAAACTECPDGHLSDYNDFLLTSCFECWPNTYLDTTAGRKCTGCPAGSNSSAGTHGSGGCELCLPGYYGFSTGQGCNECWPGSYQDSSGQTTCLACTPGRFSDNSYAARTECQPCPGGTHNNAYGQTYCGDCEPGRFQANTGRTVCEAAQAGYEPDADQLGESQCPAGKYSWATGLPECVNCPSGQFINAVGATECEACPVGRAGNDTRVTTQLCPACPDGKYAPSTGLSECLPCPYGFKSVSSGLTRDSCVECPKGTYSDAATGTASCTNCPVGTFAGTLASKECEPCPPGLAAVSPGLGACVGCPLGQFADTASTCAACDDSSYTGVLGQQECYVCPVCTLLVTGGG